MKTLDVHVFGVLVGRLIQDRWEGHYFEPNQDWLAQEQLPVLSLSYRQNLEKYPTIAKSTHLPAWFENLLPEQGSALRQVLARELDLRGGQSFSLLAALGRDLPGAVVVTPQQDVGDTLDEPRGSAAALEGELRFSSLAGNQLKFSMAKQGQAFTLPVRGAHGDWIIKLPHRSMPLLPHIEHTTMQWARAVGFEVPDTQVVSMTLIDGLDAFIDAGVQEAFAVRRFDRIPGTPLHQEDLAQVLNWMPQHKYGESDDKRATYKTVVTLLSDACGVNSFDEVLRRLAFVIGSGNGDAHLKNWSLTYTATSALPMLSPCYDQITTIAVDSFGWDGAKAPTLALGFGRARTFAQVTTNSIRAFGTKLGRDPDATLDVFSRTLVAMRDAWQTVASDAPPSMTEALQEHWQQVPLLDDMDGWQ